MLFYKKFYFLFTKSFKAFPALKTGALAAGILINYPNGETSYQIYTWRYIYNKNCDKRKMYILSDDKSLSTYIPRFNEKGNDFAIPVNRNAGEIVWENYYHTVFYEK